jgi:metallophosphoesterase superfamily enzyme
VTSLILNSFYQYCQAELVEAFLIKNNENSNKKYNHSKRSFHLNQSACIILEKEKALILSDLHIGKTAHFRKNGIALSDQIFENDLQRLSVLIEYFQPEKFIVVGDLLHAGDNSDVDKFCEWKNQFSILNFI